MADAAVQDPPVQGVPPGLIAEQLANPQPSVKGVPAGLTAEPLQPSAPTPQPYVQAPPQSNAPPPPAVPGLKAEPIHSQVAAGQTEGWMPQGHKQQLGVNPVFRPGDQPALNSAYPPAHPAPTPQTPYQPDPHSQADMPPPPPPAPLQNQAQNIPKNIPAPAVPQPATPPGAPEAVPGIPQAHKQPPGANPVYRPGENGAPNWLQKAIEFQPLPALEKAGDWIDHHMGAGNAAVIDHQKAVKDAYDKNHPLQDNVKQGIKEFLNGQTSVGNLALLAAVPQSKLITLLFTAQAAQGSYKTAEDAYQAHLRGDNPAAAKLATEAGLNGLMALGGALHLADVRTYTGPMGEKGVRAGVGPIQAEAGRVPAYRAPGPEGSYSPAEGSTVVPAQTTGRLRVGSHEFGTGAGRGATAPAPEAPAPKELGAGQPVPRETVQPPIGATEPETGRPVLQQSPHPEVSQAAATAEHPIVKSRLADLVKPIQGASISGARPEKEPDRLDEKIEDGQSPRTVRDLSGFRIAVDTPAARDQVATALRGQFQILSEQDNFTNGDEEHGFHAHTLNVREPGSPVSHEVQILPKEVADTAEDQHGLYEQARGGDEQAKAKLKELNQQRWQEFAERQGTARQPKIGRFQGVANEEGTIIPMKVDLLSPEERAAWQNSDEYITVYRAVKDGVNSLDAGDMIALNRKDAEQYADRPGVHVITQRVRKADVQWVDNPGVWPIRYRPTVKGRAGTSTETVKPADNIGAPSETEPKYKHGNTQANIPGDSPASKIIDNFRASIPDADLAGDGRDVGPGGNHVTVRYGIKGDDTEGIRKFIESQPPFTARLGPSDVFPPSEHSDGAAVVHAPIESPELARLNAEIEKHGDFAESNFKDYKPHATVAYVDPAKAELYKGKDLGGAEFPVTSITIADRHGNQTDVQLKGAAPAKPLEGKQGAATKLLTPNGEHPATYRLVEAADLTPSHDAHTFAKNPAYPEGIQERAYDTSKEAQARVIQQAQNLNPAYLVNDNPDAVNGPPVVTPDGMVLGGNSRAMTLQRVYKAGDAESYLDALRRKLPGFGLKAADLDGMKEPVLVRQIAKPGTLDETRRLGSELNKNMTGAMGVAERAVSAGKNLKPETLRQVADMLAADDLTLRELLAKKGPEIVRMVTADGLITERERPQFVDPKDGGLSDEGKTFVERALMGSVVDDPRLMDAAPKSILAKLERSLGSIAAFASRPDEWNLLPPLRQAIAEHAVIAKSGANVETNIGKSLFGDQRNPVVDELTRMLDRKPNEVRSQLQTYARDSDANRPGQGRMLGEAAAFDAFNNAFGSRLTEQEYHDGIDQAALSDPAQPAAVKNQGRDEGVSGREISQPAAGGGEGGAGSGGEPGTGIAGPGIEPAPARPVRATGPNAAAQSGAVRERPAGHLGKGAVVTLEDGSAGVVQFAQPAINGAPARTRVRLADGKVWSVNPNELKPVKSPVVDPDSHWIGVDLDGTLAKYDGFKGAEVIGPPVPAMLERVKAMLAKGEDVRIFTARIAEDASGKAKAAIEAWAQQHLGQPLPITNVKDDHMTQMYDDRAVQVERNTGKIVGGGPNAENAVARGTPAQGGQVAVNGLGKGTGLDDVQPGGRAVPAVQPERGTLPEPVPAGRVASQPTATPSSAAAAAGKAGNGAVDTGATPDSGVPATAGNAGRSAADVRLPGESTAELQERLLSKGRFARELSGAKTRLSWENATKAKLEAVTLHGAPVQVMNPDAYETIRKLAFPEEGDFAGVFLSPHEASRLVAKLRSSESNLRQRPGMKAGAESIKSMALGLDKAREEDGSLVLLRGDYDEPTMREELTHRWWQQTGLRQSEAMQEMAERPEFEQIREQLRGLGYDLNAEDQAAELIGKAMAGDPEMEWTPEQQAGIVTDALKLAVDEQGPEILKNLPPTDPKMAAAIEEAREYADSAAGRRGQEIRGVGEADREGALQNNRPQGGNVREAERAEPAGDRGQRGVQKGGAAETKLEQFKRLTQARQGTFALPGDQTLPGMGEAVAKQDEAAAEQKSRDLTAEMRQPKGDISKAAGRMERESPLFAGTDAGGQGSLFKKVPPEEQKAPTWYLKSDKLIGQKMRGPMPANALLKMLENGGIKSEELKWTGLDELLRGKGTNVVKPAEVREYLAANNLQLKEVTKGGIFVPPADVEPEQLTIRQTEHQYLAKSPNTGKEHAVGKGVVGTEAEAAKYLARYMSNVEHNAFVERDKGGEPKFSSYTLPGGENYREMLLTLPDKRGPGLTAAEKTELAELTKKVNSDKISATDRRFRELWDRSQDRPSNLREGRQQFKSGHWDEPNVLGHVRFNDRTGPEGQKLLHLEELQSDWHQKGRAQGYNDETDQTRAKMQDAGHRAEQAYDGMMDAIKRNDALGFDQPWQAKNAIMQHPDWAERWDIRDPDDKAAIQKWVDARNEAQELAKTGHEVPDAPFKKTWPELLLKRMVRYAAENGYDGISWTPGEQQAERYDLSKQIKDITLNGQGDDLDITATDHNHRRVMDRVKTTQSGLADIIGKEAAQKLLDQPEPDPMNPYAARFLRDADLKVGGEGMKGFYDKIVPDLANRIGKPFGAKVGETQIPTEPSKGQYALQREGGQPEQTFRTREAAETQADRHGPEWSVVQLPSLEGKNQAVPYLPVTDAMRKSVLTEGQPLFKKEPGQQLLPNFQSEVDKKDKENASRRTPGGVDPATLKQQAVRTTVTTGNHDTGKSLQEAVDDLAKLPRRKMTMEERVTAASDAGIRGIAEAKPAIEKAWDKLKGATAGVWSSWSQPAPWTDYLSSLGDMRKAEFKAAMDLDAYQKELKRVAPTEREREAMTAWGESGGDPVTLKRWAANAHNLPDQRFAKAFLDAQSLTPEQKAVAESHRRYYEQQLKLLMDAGLLPAGASNYAMHLFATDPETLAQLRSITDFSELASSPAFLNKRVYKSYFEAIANGEKPKTMDAGKILGTYHDAFTKTFMTRSFLRSLMYGKDETDGRPLAALESRAGWTLLDKKAGSDEARILKQPKRTEDLAGYERIPAAQLRNFTWELTDADREMLAPGYDKMPAEEQDKLFGPDDPRFPVPDNKVLAMKGDILIHPAYVSRVSDMVTKSWMDRSDSKVAATVKAIQKGGALAKSAILAGSLFHQVQLGVHSMEHLVNPFKLAEFKDVAKDPVVQQGVSHGLNLLSVDPEGVLSDLPGMATYHRYLFRDFIPRLKATMYSHAFERNMQRYGGARAGTEPKLTRDEIHLMTAKQANAAFGGLDPAFFEKLHFMNNRTYKALEHLVLFSPDFTKARAQFVVQGFGKFGQEQRLALLRGAVVIYAVARIVNAILNRDEGLKGAKWDPADALSMVTPKSWGRMGDKRLSLRTVQGDLMGLIDNPATWAYNRLNPVTLRPTIEFLTGRDNFGRQEAKAHFAKDYVKQLSPLPVQKLFTTSDEGVVSSLFQASGLNFANYRTPLETMAMKLRIKGIPDKPESDEKADEQRKNVQIVEKVRDGRMSPTDVWNQVNAGKLTAREAGAIVKRASMTELQYNVDHLQDFDDALAVWNKADPQEKAELKDVMEQKGSRRLERVAQDQGDKQAGELEAKLIDLGILDKQ